MVSKEKAILLLKSIKFTGTVKNTHIKMYIKMSVTTIQPHQNKQMDKQKTTHTQKKLSAFCKMAEEPFWLLDYLLLQS